MQIEATIVKVLPLESGVSKSTGNPWSKGTIIVEVGTNTQYPKKIALTNMKKAEELIALPIGGQFTFDIDVESREHQGRWFTSVSTFRWTPVGAQTLTQAPQPMYAQPAPSQNAHPTPQYAPTPNPYYQHAPNYVQQGNDIPF